MSILESSLTLELLEARHRVSDFDCGHPRLNRYLQRYAIENQESRYGRTYVLCARSETKSLGFYTLSMSAVAFINAPEQLVGHEIPRYPIPTVLLGCLAVDRTSQGRGYGSFLLIDAMKRALNASIAIAARVLEVDAIDENARNFYLKYGFIPFKDDKKHLCLPLQTIAKLGFLNQENRGIVQSSDLLHRSG